MSTEFGKKVKQRRTDLGLSRVELATLIERLTDESVSESAIYKWEFEGYPEAWRLPAVAVALQTSIDELFADELELLRGKVLDNDRVPPGVVTGLEVFRGHLENLSINKGDEEL